MAKNIHAVIKLQGTLGGLVFVKSRKYGDHVRTARGSFTKAKCNSVLKKNASRSAIITATASPVYQYLKTTYRGFIESSVWGSVLGRMLRADKNDPLSLLQTLEGLDLHTRHPFEKLVKNMELTVSAKAKQMLVTVETTRHPYFIRSGINSYYYDFTMLFTSAKKGPYPDLISTEWVSLTDEPPYYELCFDKPAGASNYLLIGKVTGGSHGREDTSIKSIGVQVLKVGQC